MDRTSDTATARRLARLERLAHGLDSRFRLPILGWRFGWDAVLGLIPGLGDAVTLGPAAWMLWEAHGLGARRRTLWRMGANAGLDMLIGGVPLLGDVFDAAFKANRRNLALLRTDLQRQGRVPDPGRTPPAHSPSQS